MKPQNLIFDGMYGLAVGDALGVPYETASLEEMRANPCTGMVGYGFHHQPAGTWSDDTSMSLCVADALSKGFDPEKMMKNFADWKNRGRYTAGGKVFDVGNICKEAINSFTNGVPLEFCGRSTEDGNGNGALMRTFPIAVYQCLEYSGNDDLPESFLKPIHEASKLTHAHEIGLICCGLFSLTLREWLFGRDNDESLSEIACRAYHKALR